MTTTVGTTGITVTDPQQPYWFRDFDQAARDKAAKEGAAMPDGSFPIYTQADLDAAAHRLGTTKHPRADVLAHMRKRANAQDLTLPDVAKAAAEALALVGRMSTLLIGAPLGFADPGDPEWEQADASTTSDAIGIVNELIQRESAELGADPDDADDLAFLVQIRQLLIAFQNGELSEAAGFEEPAGADLSVPTLVGGTKPRRGLNHYARKLKELLSGSVSDVTMQRAHLAARGHAGALARQGQESSYASQQYSEPGVLGRTYIEPPEWIPCLPIPHTSQHPEYGEQVITRERNERFVQNFKDGFYQTELPIDGDHDLKAGGAFGFITDLRMNADGSADARPRWTDRGATALRGDRYIAISPEWFDEWTDKVTGERRNDVLIGAALVNRPFFKHTTLRPLAASEHLIGTVFGPPTHREDAMPGKQFGDSLPMPEGDATTHGQGTGTHTHEHDDAGMDDGDADGTHAHSHTHDGDASHSGAGHSHDGVSFSEERRMSGTPTPAQQSQTFAEQLAAVRAENAALKRAFEESSATSTQMAEQVRSMREAEQTKRFTDEIMGRSEENGTAWYLGGTSAFGEDGKSVVARQVDTLRDLSKTFGEDSTQVKAYTAQQRQLAETMRHAAVFNVRGLPGADAEGNAASRLAGIARGFREADPKLSEAQAFERAVHEQPQLYEDYERERRRRAQST